MNSCNTDIFFSNYYHWQSVRFELHRDFRDNRPEIILASCLATLASYKLYSGLVLSTLWMNLVQRADLRSSRVVRPVVERASS